MTSSNGPWHRRFAWRPVRTRQHGWRWLCTVERALHYPDPLIPFTPYPYWVYRPTPHPKTANKDETRYTKPNTTTHKEKP